jgi:hypothetical protein
MINFAKSFDLLFRSHEIWSHDPHSFESVVRKHSSRVWEYSKAKQTCLSVKTRIKRVSLCFCSNYSVTTVFKENKELTNNWNEKKLKQFEKSVLIGY